ncbi:acetoacetate decarboxylase [Capronia epimyces CBS 606.96]|uniref:Acetoacetate decarboxylase n=1 Tax=Capronia epimyces CBS 606.96 TaxID=1182542 RepID=W9Y3B5_9EURO|nr:acetoacetate decarboxylase [Capronia epimyces CBS 606.96]EXJ86978.1 acetoacetate decarboxylase [Capronia epimyces CBS 606.96]
MPSGTLRTKENHGAIPLYSPPYPSGVDEFSDIECLYVQYQTKYDNVKDLVPEELELAQEPLVTLALYKYGMSPIGAYNEFVATVEVEYRGVKYPYTLELILNNQAAIFSGREKYGIPKVLGKVVWDPSAMVAQPSGFISGHVERPEGSKLAELGFKPLRKVQKLGPLRSPPRASLHLRSIPSCNPGQPPALREFVPAVFEVLEGEVWTGEPSVGLFNVSAFDPIHKLEVLRYVGATMIRHASAILHPVKETFPL